MDADARALLADLVSFETVAGTPNGELIDYAAERLDEAGARVSISEGAHREARNLHAMLGPDGPHGLVLSAHTDVVAVDGQEWTHDPFTLSERDGRLYGRGTADMKGFIAAVLAAVGAVAGRAPTRPLHVVLSSDEELGCRGIRPLLPELSEAIERPWLTVVGEPTGLRVVDRHKGKLAFAVDVRGRAGHSARATEAVNAVVYAARLIVALDELAQQLQTGPRDERFPVPHGTVSVGPIEGGVSVNIVPDRCRFEFEVRHLPGDDPDALRERIDAAVRPLHEAMRDADAGAGIELCTTIEYPALAPTDADGGDPAAAAQLAALAGTTAGGAVDFGTEAGLLQRALGAPVVVCGPGEMAQGHRPDEFVEVAQLDAAVTLLRRLIERLSGPKGAT
ncbi:MAG TPA: acetylornithine deacetylase [Solirubrobacteraceae bacterium]|nr:acetylornithine deacetylase [Solirubrobacteraceae bacterium]